LPVIHGRDARATNSSEFCWNKETPLRFTLEQRVSSSEVDG